MHDISLAYSCHWPLVCPADGRDQADRHLDSPHQVRHHVKAGRRKEAMSNPNRATVVSAPPFPITDSSLLFDSLRDYLRRDGKVLGSIRT